MTREATESHDRRRDIEAADNGDDPPARNGRAGGVSLRNIELERPFDEMPGDQPAFGLGPPNKWDPDRVRFWIVVAVMAMLGLSLLGEFVLIVAKVQVELLLAWQGAVGTIGAFAGSITTYYFTHTKRKNG